MAEFKIAKVSEQPPKEWKGPHGPVYYIKVLLEGHTKPVSVGKKKPDALRVGDIIYGNIEESDLPEDKFKPEQKPEYVKPDSKQSDEYWADKQMQIRAQWAIGQAVNSIKSDGEVTLDEIETVAKELYAMVDRVKGSSESTDPKAWTSGQTQMPSTGQTSIASGYEKAKATAQALKPDVVHDVDLDDRDIINLDDIPF